MTKPIHGAIPELVSSKHTEQKIIASKLTASLPLDTQISKIAIAAIRAEDLKPPMEDPYLLPSVVLVDETSSEKVAAVAVNTLALEIRFDDTSTEGVSDFYKIYQDPKLQEITTTGQPVPKELSEVPELSGLSRLPYYSIREEYSEKAMMTVAQPTNPGLILLAAYYEKKYGIPIRILFHQDIDKAIPGDGIPADAKCWGIIRIFENLRMNHVTPLLCHKKQDGKIEIASLDSLGWPNHPYHIIHLSEVFPDFNHELIFSAQQRQADTLSCRTDALVILKDALLFLKNKEIGSLKEIFVTTRNECRKEVFELPAFLGRTAQISKSAQDDGTSKMPTKRQESLTEFRAQYRRPVEVTKEIKYLAEYGKDRKVVALTQKNTINVNLFLNFKGKRNLTLVKKLLRENDPELMKSFLKMYREYAAKFLRTTLESIADLSFDEIERKIHS